MYLYTLTLDLIALGSLKRYRSVLGFNIIPI